VAELLAREKILYNLWLTVAAASINIAANLALIPRMGIAGAGLASTLSYTFVSLVVAWYYVKMTGVPWSTLVPRRSDLTVYTALLGRLRRTVVARPVPEAARA
jgi:O-antigen/teichoic acid export membrane protein